jgi:hypothetical protein
MTDPSTTDTMNPRTHTIDYTTDSGTPFSVTYPVIEFPPMTTDEEYDAIEAEFNAIKAQAKTSH